MYGETGLGYTIKSGDTLQKIAAEYKTTPDKILEDNPGIRPTSLVVGQIIKLRPGFKAAPELCLRDDEVSFNKDMRKVWMEHIIWTRMVILSIENGLMDKQTNVNRLNRNPSDMAGVFEGRYGKAAAATVQKLMTEHLAIGGDLFEAIAKGDKSEIVAQNVRWYQNAEEIADSFVNINPAFTVDMTRHHMFSHLDLTRREAMARKAGDYKSDVALFDEILNQAMEMADYFSAPMR